MAIIRRSQNPSSTLSAWDPFEQMRELLRGDFPQWSTEQTLADFAPAFEVKETKDSFVFKADLPGVKEQDVEVSMMGDRISISGKRESEKREEKDKYYAYERSYGSFTRLFTLPGGADADHAQAELKDGVLTLVVPKKPEVQSKRIPISGQKSKA